jgi:hypothetical protein
MAQGQRWPVVRISEEAYKHAAAMVAAREFPSIAAAVSKVVIRSGKRRRAKAA